MARLLLMLLLLLLMLLLMLLLFNWQDVVYALAHATGKTGRFTLIERWRNNERLLAPHEHPLKVTSGFTSSLYRYFRFWRLLPVLSVSALLPSAR